MNMELKPNYNNEKKHVSDLSFDMSFFRAPIPFYQHICWTLIFSRLTKYKINHVPRPKALNLQVTKKRVNMKGSKGSETKLLIRKAAFQQFLSKDYSTVPLKDIEASLHLTRGCMSYHYPTKQELFADVIDQYILKKQDVDYKVKSSDDLSLLGFINYYIENVQKTMEYLTGLLLPDIKNNCTRAYLSVILRAEENYPGFASQATLITKKELLLWEKILKRAQDNGEIRPECDCKLVAKQFKYIFYGQSFSDSLEAGLDVPSLKEQFMFIYNLIKT